MTMHQNVCRDLLWHLNRDERLHLGKSPPKVIAWLLEADLPAELEFLLWHDWPQQSAGIAHLDWDSAQDIMEAEYQSQFMQHKLLWIGGAPNGDFLVINYRTADCEVGFVSHEEMAKDRWPDPGQFYQPIARTLATFLYRAVEERYIPTDYWAARAFNNFLAEERQHAEPSAGGNAATPRASA